MDFHGKNLRNSSFSGLDLAHAIFRGADLSYSNFSAANLQGADFSDCVLHGVNFMEANLCRTNFAGAALLDPELRQKWETVVDGVCFCACDNCDCPIWERPLSRFMGDYEKGDWTDEEVLEMLVLPLIERRWRIGTDEKGWPYCTDEPDCDSSDLHEVSRNIS